MFTIKHCQDGIENLYPNAIAVTYRGEMANCGPHGVEVIFKDNRMIMFEGMISPVGSGTTTTVGQNVYVMNENGKTVASYTMGANCGSQLGRGSVAR